MRTLLRCVTCCYAAAVTAAVLAVLGGVQASLLAPCVATLHAHKPPSPALGCLIPSPTAAAGVSHSGCHASDTWCMMSSKASYTTLDSARNCW